MNTLTPNRSRGAGRPREFDMDAVIQNAMKVFQERGYHTTSIGDLTKATRLTAGSLYKAFKDKESLFLIAFTRYTDERLAQLRKLSESAVSGREALVHAMELYSDLSSTLSGKKGCLVVSSAVELSTLSDTISVVVIQSLRRTERFLTQALERGKADGSIPDQVDEKVAARFILCVLQGMRVVGKTGVSRTEMHAVVTMALKALD